MSQQEVCFLGREMVVLQDFGVGWMYIVNELSIKQEKLDIIHSAKISGCLDVGEDQNSIMS